MLHHALKIGLVVAVLGLVAQEANACCRWGGGWGCGGGGWGGCYGGGCYGGGYGYGGYGYGGYGYGRYGYGGYLASSSGGYSSRPLVSSYRPSSDSVLLTVNVPADAKVFVNGQPTRSTGARRHYTTSGLRTAKAYGFQVRAEFVRDGKPVSEEKTVQLTAGQTGSLAFSAAPNAQVADVSTEHAGIRAF